MHEIFSRKELIGDKKVNIVADTTFDPITVARHIAQERTRRDNDEAFFIVDVDALYERYVLWRQHLPQVEPFYAVKCNSDDTILRVLASLGVGFDCASREEIDKVIRIGVSPDRIIYANPCKTRSFIKHAEDKGVLMMTFDNHEELDKIAALHGSPEMILRIAVSDPTATCPLNKKFGAEPVTGAPELMKKAAQMGINVRGISFHVGSGCNDPTAYWNALQHARRLFDLGETLGFEMDIVDMGGGFPGGDHHITFEQIASLIRSAVTEFFPEPTVRLIAEPGRFFAARPFTLVTNVITATECSAAHITKNPEDQGTGYMYYMNDGVYGSFNCILFDHVHPVGRPLFDDPDAPKFPCTIWGPTCDSLDIVEEKKTMKKMRVGDWMVYDDMGAYTCAASTTFNGFARPTNIYVVGERTWCLLGL